MEIMEQQRAWQQAQDAQRAIHEERRDKRLFIALCGVAIGLVVTGIGLILGPLLTMYLSHR